VFPFAGGLYSVPISPNSGTLGDDFEYGRDGRADRSSGDEVNWFDGFLRIVPMKRGASLSGFVGAF
jgi:hypothetical protein